MDGLRELADCMLARYEAEAEGKPPRSSLVFILGAQASRASCLEEWKRFGQTLVDSLSGRFLSGSDDAFLDDAVTRLQPLIGPAPAAPDRKRDFLREKASPEQILEVACRNTIFEKEVRSQLVAAYGPKRAPQLGYELIAHFLRHRFIDHVINFNWDEILDRAIEDELGPSGYEQVLPSGRPASRSADVPRHFKLHGTASSPGSLRFTTAETGLLSHAMLEALDESLFGIRSAIGDPARPPQTCHLISFGYSWSDPDFVNYVVAHWDRFERITVVRRGIDFPVEVRRLYCLAYDEKHWLSKGGSGKISIVSAEQLGPKTGRVLGTPLVDHLLWSLWERIDQTMTCPAKTPRLRLTPVARHLLLGLYFAPISNGTVMPLEHHPNDYRPERTLFNYCESQRLRLEFFLHVMKSNGMINLSPMGQDPRITGALERVGDAQPLYSALDEPALFVPSPGSSIRETYFLTLLPSPQGGAEAGTGEILEAAGETVRAVLGLNRVGGFESHMPVWKGDELTFEPIELERLFNDSARRIFKADDVEVVAAKDPRDGVLFLKPRPLTSFARLSQESSRLLSDPWDVLLVVAESGRWIFDALAELPRASEGAPNREVYLIRTSGNDLEDWGIGRAYDIDIRKKIEDLARHGIVTRWVEIPWWRHNRHMTLSLRRRNRGIRLIKGIYFRRRLKNHRIAPVLVTEKSDCFELLLLFLGYTVRAVDHRLGPRERALGGAGETSVWERLEEFAGTLGRVLDRVHCSQTRHRDARARLRREIDEKIARLVSSATPQAGATERESERP